MGTVLAPPLSTPLSIALLSHSTNPRGGVVHALELGEALQALGQHITLYAPDPHGQGLFRPALCEFIAVPATHCASALPLLVQQRINDYIAWFERIDAPLHDVYHAQDSISANALATLTERGVIAGYVRTVHHLDDFTDPQLMAWQTRGFMCAERVLCVSHLWRDALLYDYGVTATVVGNGVNSARYNPDLDGRESVLRQRLGLSQNQCQDQTQHQNQAPVFLVVGGIEPRKNTLVILQAFIRTLNYFPKAQLLIAGGASLLDHDAYQQEFAALLAACGLAAGPGPCQAVILLGKVDDADMPALYRCATALVFASVKEGFGLAVLEAMACRTPVVVSRIAPFTEYLGKADCIWVDQNNPTSIAQGMLQACETDVAARLRQAGAVLSRQFTWTKSALQHLEHYHKHTSMEHCHA